jgi:hypothetical protein
VWFGGWSGRLCLLIVILFLSNRRVILLAPPARRTLCRSTIRITRPPAMPNFCGMHAAAFPAEAIGCSAVSRTGIVYVSSVHYRSYPVAAASIHSNRVERRLARVLVSQLPSERPVWTRLRFFTARQRLMWFNDDHRTSHADVMALFDNAIDHSTVQALIPVLTGSPASISPG